LATAIFSASALVASLQSATSVQAATLVNRDVGNYQIEVFFKSSRRAYDLASGKSLAGFCPEGCIIRLNGSEDHDFALEGSERVSIEGGLVYYDGEETKGDVSAKSDSDAAAKTETK